MYRRRGPSARAVARIAKRVVQSEQETKLQSFANVQQKIQPESGIPVDQQLCQVVQGPSQNNRIGSQITVTGLYMRNLMEGFSPGDIMRLVLYVPRDPTDTLSADTITVGSLIDFDKYTVLYDRVFGFTQAMNFRNVNIKRSFHRGRRSGIHVRFLTNSNTISKNNLRCYVVSNSSTPGNEPMLTYNWRIYYKDA